MGRQKMSGRFLFRTPPFRQSSEDDEQSKNADNRPQYYLIEGHARNLLKS